MSSIIYFKIEAHIIGTLRKRQRLPQQLPRVRRRAAEECTGAALSPLLRFVHLSGVRRAARRLHVRHAGLRLEAATLTTAAPVRAQSGAAAIARRASRGLAAVEPPDAPTPAPAAEHNRYRYSERLRGLLETRAARRLGPPERDAQPAGSARAAHLHAAARGALPVHEAHERRARPAHCAQARRTAHRHSAHSPAPEVGTISCLFAHLFVFTCFLQT